MARTLLWTVLFGSVVLLEPAVLTAADDPQQLLDAAYQQTQSAQTVEELNSIITLCQQARQVRLSAEHAAYAKKLLAWTYNRRGELYNEQAGAQMDENESQRLDAAALADFEQSVALDDTRWKSFHNRGVSYALSGKYEEAVTDFTRVLELQPEHTNAWFNRAEIRLEIGRYGPAIEDYTQVLQRDAEDAAAYAGRGRAYLYTDRAELALADFEQVLARQPDDARAYCLRGEALQAQGKWEAAAADLRKSVELDPELGRGFQAIAWLMATCPEERYRNAAMAIQAAERALQLEGPDDFRCLDTLAAAQATSGDFDAAQATQEKAIRTAPAVELAGLRQRLEMYQNKEAFRQAVNDRKEGAEQTDRNEGTAEVKETPRSAKASGT